MDSEHIYYRLVWRAADATLLAYGFYPTKENLAESLAEYYAVRNDYNFSASGEPPYYMIPHHSDAQTISFDIVALPATSPIVAKMTKEPNSLVSANVVDEEGKWIAADLALLNEARRARVIGHDSALHIVTPMTDEMRQQLPTAQIIPGPWRAKPGRPVRPAAAKRPSRATPEL